MQELKTMFGEMFFLSYFDYERTAFQIANITGQLKTTCVTLFEWRCLWVFTEVKPELQKSFIMFCLNLLYWPIFISTFSNSSSNFRTAFLFAFSLTFYDISDKFSVCLYLLVCALHKSSNCTVFLFFTLLFWLLVRRCHLFDCVPAIVRKFFCHHTLSLSVRKDQGQLQELLQKLRSLTAVDAPMIVFQFTGECPFVKMLVPESSVLSSIIAVVIPK